MRMAQATEDTTTRRTISNKTQVSSSKLRSGRRTAGFSTKQLLTIVAVVVSVLGAVAIILPKFRNAALLIAAGISLALLRYIIFKDPPGGTPFFLRSRFRRSVAVDKSD